MDGIRRKFLDYLNEIGIRPIVKIDEHGDSTNQRLGFYLDDIDANRLAPGYDTSVICYNESLDTTMSSVDLEREILLAMLVCPQPLTFSAYEELTSSVRIRRNIVQAARKTSLSFATDEAERPEEYWEYNEDRGFILKPNQPLIKALERATQPGESGKRYTFSCRRAGEYIVLLAVTMETEFVNPLLFNDLHRQSEHRALKGREFERIFHRQIGSPEKPLPLKFFIPGDRTWFRNPDPISSEIVGYEGSWTFYLGSGVFADFWRPHQVYNLTTKCLAIYHWRNSAYRDANGELQIDEQQVEALTDAALQDPAATDAILMQMIQLQEPLTVFAGGCIEPHRDSIRQICQQTADLMLPDVDSIR